MLESDASIEGHKWTLPDRAKRDNQVLLIVDVAKVDTAWKKDIGYIGPGGDNGIKGRYERFQQWLVQNPDVAIECPEIGYNEEIGRISFTNGRHRFAVLRDMGVKHLGVAVTKNQAKIFMKLFK